MIFGAQLLVNLFVQKQFQGHIDRHQLCKITDKILLAVSGGLDSMVMLKLFLEAGYPIAVAHCNFQLRGIESDEDENFVRRQCALYQVRFHSIHFDTNTYAHDRGISTQMAARELRYEWFSKLLESEKMDKLATAHHLNDALETVLLNLTHGTDLRGMAGIPVNHEKTIRPLLFATREEIESYAASRQITWREDMSNSEDHYQRNYVRQHVIPQLKKINPSLEKTFSVTQSKLRGELSLMKEGLDSFISRYVIHKDGRVQILKAGLQNQTHPVPVLWEVLKQYGFNFEQCVEIIESLRGQSGKKFFSATHTLVVDREYFVLMSPSNFNGSVEIHAGQSEVSLGHWNLRIQKMQVTISEEPGVACLDASKVKFPLIWRRWQPGDSFFPLGIRGSKKVSDFLIDKKISVADKESVTVIECKGEIIWVVGHRLDDRFKITPTTEEALQLQLIYRSDQSTF